MSQVRINESMVMFLNKKFDDPDSSALLELHLKKSRTTTSI
jgi:hypothetical protein